MKFTGAVASEVLIVVAILMAATFATSTGTISRAIANYF